MVTDIITFSVFLMVVSNRLLFKGDVHIDLMGCFSWVQHVWVPTYRDSRHYLRIVPMKERVPLAAGGVVRLSPGFSTRGAHSLGFPSAVSDPAVSRIAKRFWSLVSGGVS